MGLFLWRAVALLVLGLSIAVRAQDDDDGDGYIGYNLDRRGDESAGYETSRTSTGIRVLSEEPDIYLNASVGVDAIIIEVDNITAKVNLDAQVLNLLHFSAGIDASIDRVRLSIINVSAQVELEARLENVVEMISDVLHSIDLNPIIATLGKDVNKIVNNLTGTLGRPVDSKGNPPPSRHFCHSCRSCQAQPCPVAAGLQARAQHSLLGQRLQRAHAHEPHAGFQRFHHRRVPRQRGRRIGTGHRWILQP